MFVALKHRFLAMIAMALLGVIALNLVRGDLAIDQAAMRAFLLVVIAATVDRLVMPIIYVIVGLEQKAAPAGKKSKKSKDDDDADEDEAVAADA